MSDLNLEAILSVELLRPQPGDIVIFRHPMRLLIQAQQRIIAQLKEIVPEGCQVIILEEGADIKLLRPERAEHYVEGEKG